MMSIAPRSKKIAFEIVNGGFMEYGMVSSLIPDEYNKKFRLESKNTMQDAANALQWSIYYGLCENLECTFPLFNILPCGSYPQYYKRPFIPRFSFAQKGKNLNFCNIKLFRNFCKTATLKKEIKKWCKSNKENKVLFVYTLSQPLLSAIADVKKKNKGMHICAIVADLPDMSNLSSKKSFFLKLYTKYKAKRSYSLLSFIDTFVLLTKQMADYMRLSQPYLVMEGIAPDPVEKECYVNSTENSVNSDEKIILYTGTLHRKFGVMHLLEAFEHIESSDVKLVICGIGDCENEIRQKAEANNRIRFMGQLSREEVLQLHKRATVLINPRLNNEEYTKYSFPSKTMEYLMSGVPVVAYKLDGIPDEYDSYISYPTDNAVKTLADTLNRMCELSEDERLQIGRRARLFVSEQKNRRIQTKRILDFVQKSISQDKD